MKKSLNSITHIFASFLILVFIFTPRIGFSKLAEASRITLIAGGDVEWSRVVKKKPEIYNRMYVNKIYKNKWENLFNKICVKMGIKERKRNWVVPYLATPQSKAYLEKMFDCKLEDSHHNCSLQYGLEFHSNDEFIAYPFQKIRPLLHEADIVFVNLETPLANRSRYVGDFRTPTAFANSLKWAGIDVVSTANNHALDAEGEGLIETHKALLQENIGAVGTGKDIADARRPFIIVKKGISIGFLGYSQYTNFGKGGFALNSRSGVVPLDPFLIREDIQSLRDQVDFIILSFHWGFENDQNIHSDARNFAHAAIDAGADVILGHGPHVPRGIEIYNEKLIIYSLGNFIFGHNHEFWMDNFLARLTLSPDQIEKIEIIPISGKGKNLAQPYKLEGESAHRTLKNIQILTKKLNTKMRIEKDLGVVIAPTNCR